MKKFLSFVATFVAICSLCCCGSKRAPQGVFERTVLFVNGDAGSKYYRIPAVVTAADGSVVAVADKRMDCLWDLPNHIDIVCRRSEDLGRTWSEPVTIAGKDTAMGYGDAAVVLDRQSGRLICLMVADNGLWQSCADHYAHLMMAVSEDHGRTWSEPRDLSNQLYGPDCPDSLRCRWYGAFFASGAALQLKEGRLMVVMVTRTKPERGGDLSCYVAYSDDGGEHWSVSQTPGDYRGDEAKLVELTNGDILMSIRNKDQGARRMALSHDRGVTWEATYEQTDLLDPACNGDIIRYNYGADSFLLHSIPYHAHNRENVSILVSYDEGKTWPVKRSLCPGEAGYSALTQLADGTIGCFVEEGNFQEGFQMVFYRFSPDWLTK